MDGKTALARKLRSTEARAKYDAACKSLLAEKCILARIMKECMEEYRDCGVDEIAEKYIEGRPLVAEVPVYPEDAGAAIHGSDTADKSVSEGTVTYDIRFTAIAPGADAYTYVCLYVDVEAQNDFYPGYPIPKRGIYYCCRLISSQSGVEFVSPHFEKIKKVYSLWICMDPPKARQNTITRYRMTEENLIGQVREPVPNYDLISLIIVCLGDRDSEDSKGVLRMLSVLLSNTVSAPEKEKILEEDFGIPMTQALKEEVSAVCDLSKGVWEHGMAEGRAQGRVEGRAEGRVEGRVEGIIEATLTNLRSLMEATGWPARQAMAALKIPEAEQAEYEKRLLS